MNFSVRTILIAQFLIVALFIIVALGFVVVFGRRLRRHDKEISNQLALPYGLRLLQSGQFQISFLLALTAMSAISFAVMRVPGPWPEKMMVIMVQWMCLASWLNRNYLHPLQATISYAVRRRLAVVGFIGSISLIPLLMVNIWPFRTSHAKGAHPISFGDFVLYGSLLGIAAMAIWKLVRGLDPREKWSSSEPWPIRPTSDSARDT